MEILSVVTRVVISIACGLLIPIVWMGIWKPSKFQEGWNYSDLLLAGLSIVIVGCIVFL